MTEKKTGTSRKPAATKKTTATKAVAPAPEDKTKKTSTVVADSGKPAEKSKKQKASEAKVNIKTPKKKNPKIILYKKKGVILTDLLEEYSELKKGGPCLNTYQKKAIRRFHREEALKPYQAELIRMQKCLENNKRRMIILFEGRDAPPTGQPVHE